MMGNKTVAFLGFTLLCAAIAFAVISESGLDNSTVLRVFAVGMATGVALTRTVIAWRQSPERAESK